MDPERILRGVSTWIAPIAVLAAFVVGVTLGLGPALLVLAGAMLLGVVLLFWSSLGRLTGESPLSLEEAIGLGAPSPEEERKRSVLRALKDLEFERSVGKINEQDYAELSARYRADAKALLQAIEEENAPRRAEAEARLAARLSGETREALRGRKKKRTKTAPATPSALSARASQPDVDSEMPAAVVETGPSARVSADALGCPQCSTKNDVDARFCKRCGAILSSEVEREPLREEESR
jgi:hypothetical protein